MPDDQVIAPTITNQREVLATPLTTAMPLRIPRRSSFALLHLLQTLRVPFIKHRQQAMQGMCPDSLRHECLADRVARTAPYLYIRSLPG
jgi:hypothetical protein